MKNNNTHKKQLLALLACSALIFSGCTNTQTRDPFMKSSIGDDQFNNPYSTIRYKNEKLVKDFDQITELNIFYIDNLNSNTAFNVKNGKKSAVKENNATEYSSTARSELAQSIIKYAPLELRGAGIAANAVKLEPNTTIDLPTINRHFPNRKPNQPLLIISPSVVKINCAAGCAVAITVGSQIVDTKFGKPLWRSSCRLPIRSVLSNSYETLGKEFGKELVSSLREAVLIGLSEARINAT